MNETAPDGPAVASGGGVSAAPGVAPTTARSSIPLVAVYDQAVAAFTEGEAMLAAGMDVAAWTQYLRCLAFLALNRWELEHHVDYLRKA